MDRGNKYMATNAYSFSNRSTKRFTIPASQTVFSARRIKAEPKSIRSRHKKNMLLPSGKKERVGDRRDLSPRQRVAAYTPNYQAGYRACG